MGKNGSQPPQEGAIEAICRSFQIETEELLAEFRSEEKKRVSAQRSEMLASKIAHLKDEEFDLVITVIDSFLSKIDPERRSSRTTIISSENALIAVRTSCLFSTDEIAFKL